MSMLMAEFEATNGFQETTTDELFMVSGGSGSPSSSGWSAGFGENGLGVSYDNGSFTTTGSVSYDFSSGAVTVGISFSW